MITRLRARLKRLLGKRYTVVVQTTERAAAAFGVAFAGKTILAEGFEVHQALAVTWWQTAALSGLAAAVSVVQSSLTALITGDPKLTSLLRPRKAKG